MFNFIFSLIFSSKSDHYLEIWPPAFRTYNLMVPNFFNIPAYTVGVGECDSAGLALYVSSRVAECPYCSAHTCSYALRRGAKVETVAHALVPGYEKFNEKELATIAMARAVAKIPSEVNPEILERFHAAFPAPYDAEMVAMGAVGMGLLNKYMDSLGVPLEPQTVAETKALLQTEGEGKI
jgi:hypothetical protein